MDKSSSPKAKSPLLATILLCATGTGTRLLLSAAFRAYAARPGSPTVWLLGAGAVLAAALTIILFLTIWKDEENWALYLGAAILFVLFFKLGRYRPEISSIELPLAVFALTPAGLLIWAFARQVRRADELQQRILLEALAASFVVQFAAAIVFAFLEGLGIPRPPSVLWASLLVLSWSAALAVRSARYERGPAPSRE